MASSAELAIFPPVSVQEASREASQEASLDVCWSPAVDVADVDVDVDVDSEVATESHSFVRSGIHVNSREFT